jgi:hypothetical protein
MGSFVFLHKTQKNIFKDMIQITKGIANTVVLTLKEKTTLTNPKYLFVFKNDQSNVDSKFIAADTSTYPDRYNKFVITEKTSSPNPLTGEVTLSLDGFYTYTIYEQTSSTNLNPANATKVVETGKVQVFATATADHTYSPDSNITYIYNG